MKSGHSIIAVILMLYFFPSCVGYKHIPYFQNIPSDSSGVVYRDGVRIPATAVNELRIQSNDILNITIQTIDPELNEVFTPPSYQRTSSSTLMNGNTTNVIGYLVDADGVVELPVAGKINLGGLTTAEARDIIRVKAGKFYKDPVVNVQIVNFKITVIGEVLRPGSYLINGERATILDAIGQAGDLTIYGLRNNVLLSRKENGVQKMVRFDLTNSDIYNSPYFYLQQGDVVYVQPSKGKASANDQAMLKYYALITSTLSLAAILATRL